MLSNRWYIELDTLQPMDYDPPGRAYSLTRMYDDWATEINNWIHLYAFNQGMAEGGGMVAALKHLTDARDGNGEAPPNQVVGTLLQLEQAFDQVQWNFMHVWGGIDRARGMFLILAQRLDNVIKVIKKITEDDLLDEQVLLSFMDGSLRNAEPIPKPSSESGTTSGNSSTGA